MNWPSCGHDDGVSSRRYLVQSHRTSRWSRWGVAGPQRRPSIKTRRLLGRPRSYFPLHGSRRTQASCTGESTDDAFGPKWNIDVCVLRQGSQMLSSTSSPLLSPHNHAGPGHGQLQRSAWLLKPPPAVSRVAVLKHARRYFWPTLTPTTPSQTAVRIRYSTYARHRCLCHHRPGIPLIAAPSHRTCSREKAPKRATQSVIFRASNVLVTCTNMYHMLRSQYAIYEAERRVRP